MNKVAIILINYKDYAQKFLTECRDGLRAQNYPLELFKIYIIDNASSQDSINYLKNNFPEAEILPRQDGNYCAANNFGIRKASEDGFEYFVIANMDVKFDKDWLTEMVQAAESSKEIGIVQSKILLYKNNYSEMGDRKINSLGNIIHFLGFGFTSDYNKLDKEIIGLPEIKGYASGASFIIKKEVIDKIGGYNEEYYMYHDDLELGWKTKLAGYRIVLAPKSVVFHKYEFSRSVKMIYYMERNRYITVFTFYKLPTILLILPALAMMDVGMFFYSIAGGWFKQFINVYWYFLKPGSWIKIFKERRKIKSIRAKNDRDIIKNFSGQVRFQEIDNPVLRYIANPFFNFYWKIVKKAIRW